MPATASDVPLTLDPETDDLRPVAVLVADLTGRRPSPPTVWRWCVRGTRRAGKLPALRVFGSWNTTRQALLTWLQAESSRKSEESLGDREEGERTGETRQRLQEAGLL